MTPRPAPLPHWWLLRHAAPMVQEGICYGQFDLAADIEHTHHAALGFSRFVLDRHASNGGRMVRVLSSPLQRCLQLARAVQHDLLQRGLACTLEVEPRLMEMDFGAWEGQPWDDVSRREWDEWMADFAGYRVGGHGESLRRLLERVEQLQREQAPPEPGEWIVWVTHAGVIKALDLLAQGLGAHDIKSPRQWPQSSCPYGNWLAAPMAHMGTKGQ